MGKHVVAIWTRGKQNCLSRKRQNGPCVLKKFPNFDFKKLNKWKLYCHPKPLGVGGLYVHMMNIPMMNNQYEGASMIKWTKKVLRYTKTIIFGIKSLKVVAKCCFNWISYHDDLCCCVEYSTVEYQVEIFNTYH